MDNDEEGEFSSSDYELYLLISKFLLSGPCKKSAECLRKEIEENGLVPKRYDWTGGRHAQSFQNYLDSNRHVAPDHLRKICSRFCDVLDKVVPTSVSGVRTFLGAGRLSLLRKEEDVKFTKWSGKMNSVLRHQQPILHPHNLQNVPNICHVLDGRQTCGVDRLDRRIPILMYESRMLMHRRVLGHLSAVFCLLYDRTGQYILTGADDCLIKVWSTRNCRLLSTFRGHSGEVSDMALNHENTILASGGCDKTVRIWCLRTGAQITVLHAHSSGVSAVQFCPLVRGETNYLVSTGCDGCVCFWKYSNDGAYNFESKPIKFIERSRAGAQMLCQSFSPGGVFLATGSTDQSIRVYSFLSLHPEKISEVDPHTDRVDSIQFSNHGDRFMSGSRDGTARIWQYKRQEWHFMTLSMTTRLNNSGVPESDEIRSKLKVTMVRWSLGDEYVITAVSDCSIKLWNSWTGSLVQVMEGHEDEVFVIEINPADSRIILTAGHDGKINLWSIPDGRLVKSFTNTIPGQGRGAVFDCKFSPDGQTFAATDSHGHLIIFGLGSSDPYMCVPNEQFFHTDYRPLIRDGMGFVLDEQTQQPPHLMPPPFLVDMDGCPHPIQYQRLVPGRENCTDTQLIPQIGTADNGDREVVGDDFNPDYDDELVPVGVANDRNHREIDAAIANLQGEDDGLVNGHDLAPIPLASPDRQPGVRRASGNVPVSQVATNQDLLAWSKRRIIRELDHGTLSRCEAMRQVHAESELSRFMKERKLKPKPISRSDSSDGGYNIKTRRKKKGRGRSACVNQMEDTAVNRLITRALYDTEVEESSTTTDVQEQDEREPIVSSEDENAAESSDYSDWMADAQVNLQPPLRTSKRTRKRPLRIALQSSDEELEEEEQEEEEEEQEDASEAESVANNSEAAKTSGPNKSSQRTSNRRRKRRKKSIPDTELAKSQKSDNKKSASSNKKDIKEMPPQFAPTEWLTGVLPRKLPYSPQMGDEIVYLRQGHELYVNAVLRTKLYKIDVKSLPYMRNPSLGDVEYAKVIGIKYEVRPPRLASLKLGYINPMTGNLMKESFTIKYHDMPDVLDFVVLRQSFDQANDRNWRVGDRFCSIIDDAWWMGTIDKRGPVDKLYPDSPFQCFRVKWDNGESELMSPWDLEPLEDHRIASEKGSSKPVSAADHVALTYRPKESEWPPCGRDIECDRLAKGLESILQLSIAEPFIAPVDLNKYPIYGMIIAYLIDLSTIKTRLENRYYRRITALQFDVRYIEMNARKFNETGSEIIKRAKLIAKLVLEFIRLTECDDVMSLFRGMKENGEVNSDSDTEIEVENGQSTSTKHTTQSDGSPTRRPMRNDYVVTSDSWKQHSRQLLLAVIEMDDATPFREPVNTDVYPQYLDVISDPMDLGTVLNKLNEEQYTDPTELQKDLRLIFKNSKAFNNKKSKIYTMTLRLSAHIEEKLRNILSDWKAAVRCERNTRSSSRLKPRSARNTAVVPPATVPTTSASDVPGPSGARPLPSRGRALRTRSAGVLMSEAVMKLDSESEESSSELTDKSSSNTEVENDHECVERVWGNRRKGKATSKQQIKRSKPRKVQKEEEDEEETDVSDTNETVHSEHGSTDDSETEIESESDDSPSRRTRSRQRSETKERQLESASDTEEDSPLSRSRRRVKKRRLSDSASESDIEKSPRSRRSVSKRKRKFSRSASESANEVSPRKRRLSPKRSRKATNNCITNGSLTKQRTSLRTRNKNPRYCEEESEEEDEENVVISAHSVSSRGRVRKFTEKVRRANPR